jgi:hypothetical protein
MVNKVTLNVFEILEKTAAAKTKKEKISILHEHDKCWALKDILRGSFDTSLKFNLPMGSVPYEPARPESHPSNLLKENSKFKFFIKGGMGDKMAKVKREKIFLDMVEMIHPRDAELVCAMINKKLKIKGITKKLVQEAYPGLIKE